MLVQAAGMVLRKEDYTVRVPRSQRGGEIVEPLIREQWFVRMQPLAEPALQVALHTPLHLLKSNFLPPPPPPPPPFQAHLALQRRSAEATATSAEINHCSGCC